MVSGKYSALAGAVSREQAINNISANLANVSTTGYKRSMVDFESILRGSRQIHQAKGINYDRVKQNYTDFSPGPIRQTGDPLNFAIHGPGFFKVRGPNGTLYTRRGDFAVDSNGILRTSNGMPVLDDANAEITIPDTDVSKVSATDDGAISVIEPDGTSAEVARLAVVDVDDHLKLKREPYTSYSLMQGGNEIPVATPQVVQGSLEDSNVDMVAEMAKMMNSYRTFQTYTKVLQGYGKIEDTQVELGTLG